MMYPKCTSWAGLGFGGGEVGTAVDGTVQALADHAKSDPVRFHGNSKLCCNLEVAP